VKPSNRNLDTTTLARAASIITGRSRIARRTTSGAMAVVRVRVMIREVQQSVEEIVMASGWKWEWEIGCG